MNDGNMKGHKMKPIYLSFVFSDKSNPKDRAKGKAKQMFMVRRTVFYFPTQKLLKTIFERE